MSKTDVVEVEIGTGEEIPKVSLLFVEGLISLKAIGPWEMTGQEEEFLQLMEPFVREEIIPKFLGDPLDEEAKEDLQEEVENFLESLIALGKLKQTAGAWSVDPYVSVFRPRTKYG